MDINNITDYIEYGIISQMLSGCSNDSDAFNVMLESMMKAMDQKGENVTDGGSYINGKLQQNTGNNSDYGNVNPDIEKAVDEASKKYGVDKSLIMAVIKHESSFVPYVTSSAGAMGLMQLMPDTAKELGVSNPYDVEENVDGGTKYLSNLLQMYGNVKELALSAYSAGSGTLKKYGVDSDDKITRLPLETQNYVKSIMKSYDK